MGLFGLGDYSKSGPGIDKNVPEKRRFFQFFDLLFEKFGKLALANLLFAVCVIICALIFWGLYLLTDEIYIALAAFIPIMIPVCALSKLTKKIACDEPVFVFSDFMDALADNWKQGLLIGLVDFPFVVVFSMLFSYFAKIFSTNPLFMASCSFSVIIVLYFCFMQIHLPLFASTFELGFIDLLKNSAIFSIINLKSNFLTVIIGAVMTFLTLLSFELIETPIYSGIAVVVWVVIGFALLSFIANFSSWPKVYELLVAPSEEDEEADGEEE
ncbi:MAG: hypothetical protein IJL87_10595 [Clostridia bacterium]|nr:hypothetical protein [Clostridia bacterium]